jgi:hypothetical protein
MSFLLSINIPNDANKLSTLSLGGALGVLADVFRVALAIVALDLLAMCCDLSCGMDQT